MESAKRIGGLWNHWYTRYLLSTELYMVEPWERVVMHVLFAVVFSLFWYFNYSIIVNVISQIRESPHVEEL